MSLRALLTLPYLALVLALAAVLGGLSYHAANQSVDELAGRLSVEITQRINDTTQAYLNNWHYVLAATAVDRWDSQAPAALARAEQNLWHGSAVSSVRPSYVYLATADQRFVGVQRPVAGPALLKWREAPSQLKRDLFEIDRPGDRKHPLGLEGKAFDATTRPWFERAAKSQHEAWSPVYLDHASNQPMVTLAHAYRFNSGPMAGALSHVVGADVPLAYLQTFLEGLNIANGGVAFIVTRDGKLVASSQAAHALPTQAQALPTVAEHWDRLLVQTAEALGTHLQQGREPINAAFDNAKHGRVLVSALPMSAATGMDWWVVLSLPDDSLMARVRHNAYRTVALALLACCTAVAVGMWVMHRLALDVGQLTQAAEQLSLDAVPEPLRLLRGGELGRLASAFNRMITRLAATNTTVREQNIALENTVHELKQQAQARDSADARLRRIADALQEGLIVLNRDWCMTFANQQSERFIPGKHLEFVGVDIRTLYPELANSEFGLALEQAWRTNQPVAVEAPALTLPGVWIGLRLFPTPFGVAAFLSDVTDQRAARQALAHREQQLSELTAELLRIQVEERRNIARELHEDFGQSLGALRIHLQMTAASLPDDAQQQQSLNQALAQTTMLLHQVRHRSLELHPTVLDDLGLLDALQWWCEHESQRRGVPIELTAPAVLERLNIAVETACFRIVQEAVNHALVHAQATSIEVHLQVDRAVCISIIDNGHGSTADLPPSATSALGLSSMHERAQQMGGTLTVSQDPLGGTAVRLTLPLNDDSKPIETSTEATHATA